MALRAPTPRKAAKRIWPMDEADCGNVSNPGAELMAQYRTSNVEP
jgi:hypothetical protein